MNEKKTSILISAAVHEETAPLVGLLGKFEKTVAGSREVMLFPDIDGKTVRISVSGPGMVNSAHALTVAIESCRPDIIMQCGCAGIFRSSGLDIGDVAIASSERDIHLGIESEGSRDSIDTEMPPSPLPFDIPGTGRNGIIDLSGDLYEKCYRIISECRDFRTSSGDFITVSTVTATDRRAALLEKWYNNPVMESMEGAAGAQIAALYGIPFIEIRAGSNFVGKRNRESWNLPLAFRNSSLAVIRVINSI